MTEIETIESERRAAMITGDVAKLEQIIDDAALYVHTNGLRETKEEYVEMVRNGSYRYQDVTQPEMAIRMLGEDVAVVTGRTILHAILPGGEIKIVDGLSIVLWVRRDAHWKMQHYQGTRA